MAQDDTKKNDNQTEQEETRIRGVWVPLHQPRRQEPDDDLGGVWTHIYEYDDGQLEFGRETDPRYTVPIIKNDAGEYCFDRANVVWIDGVLFEEERKRLLDEYDDPRLLLSRIRDLEPVPPEENEI